MCCVSENFVDGFLAGAMALEGNGQIRRTCLTELALLAGDAMGLIGADPNPIASGGAPAVTALGAGHSDHAGMTFGHELIQLGLVLAGDVDGEVIRCVELQQGFAPAEIVLIGHVMGVAPGLLAPAALADFTSFDLVGTATAVGGEVTGNEQADQLSVGNTAELGQHLGVADGMA